MVDAGHQPAWCRGRRGTDCLWRRPLARADRDRRRRHHRWRHAGSRGSTWCELGPDRNGRPAPCPRDTRLVRPDDPQHRPRFRLEYVRDFGHRRGSATRRRRRCSLALCDRRWCARDTAGRAGTRTRGAKAPPPIDGTPRRRVNSLSPDSPRPRWHVVGARQRRGGWHWPDGRD